MTTHITFGTDHDRAHPWIGSPRLSEGYLTIELPNVRPGVERDVAFAVLGPRFAFDYSDSEQWRKDNEAKGYYPAGELARITLITQAQRYAALNIIEEATLNQSVGLHLDTGVDRLLHKAVALLADIIGTE